MVLAPPFARFWTVWLLLALVNALCPVPDPDSIRVAAAGAGSGMAQQRWVKVPAPLPRQHDVSLSALSMLPAGGVGMASVGPPFFGDGQAPYRQLYTKDGGRHWRRVGDLDLVRLWMNGRRGAYGLGSDGTLYRWDRDADAWFVSMPPDRQVLDVRVLRSGRAFAYGAVASLDDTTREEQVWLTARRFSDAWRRVWRRRLEAYSERGIRSMAALSSRAAWIGLGDGSIYFYDGQRWREQRKRIAQPTVDAVVQLAAVDSSCVFALLQRATRAAILRFDGRHWGEKLRAKSIDSMEVAGRRSAFVIAEDPGEPRLRQLLKWDGTGFVPETSIGLWWDDEFQLRAVSDRFAVAVQVVSRDWWTDECFDLAAHTWDGRRWTWAANLTSLRDAGSLLLVEGLAPLSPRSALVALSRSEEYGEGFFISGILKGFWRLA